MFDGHALACYDSKSGKQLGKLRMPVKHPTCPVFGGPKLDVLYVTCKGLEPEEGAGGIFAVKIPDVHGLAASYSANVQLTVDRPK